MLSRAEKDYSCIRSGRKSSRWCDGQGFSLPRGMKGHAASTPFHPALAAEDKFTCRRKNSGTAMAPFSFSLRPGQAVGLFARGNLAGDCQRFQIDDRDFVFFADGYKSA